jgi:hypothetical protein
MTKSLKTKAKDTALVFQAKMDAGPLTDREIRLKIKALREVLKVRKERRAAEKKHT